MHRCLCSRLLPPSTHIHPLGNMFFSTSHTHPTCSVMFSWLPRGWLLRIMLYGGFLRCCQPWTGHLWPSAPTQLWPTTGFWQLVTPLCSHGNMLCPALGNIAWDLVPCILPAERKWPLETMCASASVLWPLYSPWSKHWGGRVSKSQTGEKNNPLWAFPQEVIETSSRHHQSNLISFKILLGGIQEELNIHWVALFASWVGRSSYLAMHSNSNSSS